MPAPNCVGEEMALITLFDHVEEDEHPDSKYDSDDVYWTLPQFLNDEDYSGAKESCLEDCDVENLFQDEDGDGSSDDGVEEVDLVHTNHRLAFMRNDIAQMFAYSPMHPKEWFEAFRSERFWAEVEHPQPQY